MSHTQHHVAISYQGFIQQVTRLIALGYRQGLLMTYPLEKRDRWSQTDAKLIRQYPPLSVSKFVRARRKATGRLNVQLIRWEQYALILATAGSDDCGITQREKFVPVQALKSIAIGTDQELPIRFLQSNGQWTTALDKRACQNVKCYYEALAQHAPLRVAQAEFQQLERDLPSTRGLLAQKKLIRRALVLSARRAGKRWSATDFPVANLKKSYKVFVPATTS